MMYINYIIYNTFIYIIDISLIYQMIHINILDIYLYIAILDDIVIY